MLFENAQIRVDSTPRFARILSLRNVSIELERVTGLSTNERIDVARVTGIPLAHQPTKPNDVLRRDVMTDPPRYRRFSINAHRDLSSRVPR